MRSVVWFYEVLIIFLHRSIQTVKLLIYANLRHGKTSGINNTIIVINHRILDILTKTRKKLDFLNIIGNEFQRLVAELQWP